MEIILDRIKERVAQRDSPIRTVKAVAGAIGMSEAGFYTMIKRKTTKQGTLMAIAKSLDVDVSYLTGDTNDLSEDKATEADVLLRIESRIREMEQFYEEQLKAKDQQIASLTRMLETVLGKSEGAIDEPLFTGQPFETLLHTYRLAGYTQLSKPMFQRVLTVQK